MPHLAAAAALLFSLPGCMDGLNPPGTGVTPRDYLGKAFATWTIEVDATSGGSPSQQVLDGLASRLRAVAHPTIQVVRDQTLPSTAKAWSDADIERLHQETQGRRTGGSTVTTHVLFLDGHSVHDKGNRRVLGIAYGYDLIVLFPSSIDASCSTFALPPCTYSRSEIMLPVLVHEFGHAMGLVNRGIPMVQPHEASTCGDQPDQGHSTNKESVMYCAVDTGGLLQLLGGDIPLEFDDLDRQDLRAAGGK